MRIISWNINGITRHYDELIELANRYLPDIICLQKVKSKDGIDEFPLYGFRPFWRMCDYGQYSGVATYYHKDMTAHSLDSLSLSDDGHLQALEFSEFTLLNTYVPYSNKNVPGAIERRKQWNKLYIPFVTECANQKAVVICGDLNIVHKPIDAVDGVNIKSSGNYYKWEHEDFDRLLAEANLVDSLRELQPDTPIFSYFFQHKHKTDPRYGWRLDYALVSRPLLPKVTIADILDFGTAPSKPIILDFD